MLIREKDKLTLVQLFEKLTLPVEIWGYGSRIDGTAHSASDIDLVLRTHNLQPLPYGQYNDLVEKIKESNIPVLVELRDWAMLPANFQEQIKRHYEVFYTTIFENAVNAAP